MPSMPQNVPPFEWTDDALKLRQFVWEYWGEHGRGPTLLDVHQATGLSRRDTIQAYKQLQLGVLCVVQEDTQNCNLIKFQPFSSFPSQVKAFVDGAFHSFVGCAMESMAFSKMPPFAGKEVRFESWCACCLEPMSYTSTDGGVPENRSHPDMRIHVGLSPWDWGNVDITLMCDSMNLVIDPDHAERYERQVSRRGVMLTPDQAVLFVSVVAKDRMWDYHWPTVPMMPAMIFKGMEMLGVDTSSWE